MKILALDPGTRHAGLALVEDSPRLPRILRAWRTVHTSTVLSRRLASLVTQSRAIVECCGADLLVIERPPPVFRRGRGLKQDHLYTLGMGAGVVLGLWLEKHSPESVHEVPVGAWRKVFRSQLKRGDDYKARAVEFVCRVLGYEVKHHDSAEAILLGVACFLNPELVGYPQTTNRLLTPEKGRRRGA